MTTPVSTIKTDKVWFKDVYVLSRVDRLTEFFPNQAQTFEERMNSVVRMGIYSSLLLVVYKRQWKYILWIPLVLLLTYLIQKNYKKERFEEEKVIKSAMKNKKVAPTINNPFMNTTMEDYRNNPKKEASENYYQDTEDAKKIREDIEEKFNFNLYQSLDDVYDKKNSQRQFYTTPNTAIPSDQDKYLKFLYGKMDSCKTNGENCKLPDDGLRRNPQIFPNQNENPTVSGEALQNIT